MPNFVDGLPLLRLRMPAIALVLWAVFALSAPLTRAQELIKGAAPAAGPSTRWVTQPGQHWSFAGEPLDALPKGWTPAAGTWALAADPTAPSRGSVLALSHGDAAEPFNLILAETPRRFRNLDLAVRMHAVAGLEDRGGGLAWRVRDAHNYYVVRYNPLEGDLALFKVIDGKRDLITSVPAHPENPRGWIKLRVVAAGERIWCYLDDDLLIEATDDAIPDWGRVGLWTKADAQTRFDAPTVSAFAPPDTRADIARVLFVGFHDRAVESMSEASAEVGLPIRMLAINDADTPGMAAQLTAESDYSKYDVVFILHTQEAEGHLMPDRMRAAKAKNPKVRFIMLDQRPAAQQEMMDSGLLEVDPQVQQYWRGFTPENLKRLLIYTQVKYLGLAGEIRPPLANMSAGFWNPDAPRTYASWAEYAAWEKSRPTYRAGQSLAAMIVQLDYIAYDNHAVYDAVMKELESRGIRTVAVFGPVPDMQALLRDCKPNLLMLQHHSGPEDEGDPAHGRKPFIEELGVPYLFCSGMVGGLTVEDWASDVRGVKHGRWYGEMARHELFGIIEPFLVGMRGATAYGFSMDAPVMERVHRFADRAQGWINLQRKPDADKRVAVIYFHQTLGRQDVGRPAQEMSRYLDPIASLVVLLREMNKAGYTVDHPPETPEALLDLMKRSGRNVASWSPGDLDELVRDGKPVLIPEAQYLAWYNAKLPAADRAAVEKAHGPAPGKLMVTERDGQKFIVLPAIQLGNVLLAPQPDRGNLQDQSLLHSRTAPPPHNYLAFYWWLQEGFKADALIHFGTHGSEMYLPGKEIFLSGEDFPDLIMGSMPNFDIWTVTNVGEALISKRRAYAVIVDHLTPPILPTARDADATKLTDLVDRLQRTPAIPIRDEFLRDLEAAVRTSPLAAEAGISLGVTDHLTDPQVATLAAHLSHLDQATFQDGMHVLAIPMSEPRAIAFVTQIVARNTDLLRKIGGDAREAELKARALFKAILIDNRPDPTDVDLKPELALAWKTYAGLGGVGAEITNLLAGLDGRYIPTGPGGDPIARPESLPTGRNLYGVSPAEIPAKQAWELAGKLTDKLIADHLAKNAGHYPRQFAFTMTGMETFRDMGVMEAEVLRLIGVQPVWNPGGSVVGLTLVRREALARPRVDVVMSVNSIYLKNFPQCLRLLNEAVDLAAGADEPDNAVRIDTAENRAFILSEGGSEARAKSLASARIFGGAPGDNTARLIFLLPRSGIWQGTDDIMSVWRDTRTNVFTEETWGAPEKKLHDRVYARTDSIISNWSDNLLGPLTNHHWTEETGGLALSVDSLTGRKIPVTVMDLRRPGEPVASTLEETIALEMRSLALNPDWIRGQMEHGYIGATQFMQIVDNTFRWNAVRQGATWNGAFDELVDTYIHDKQKLGIRDFFEAKNPHALQQIAATLLESSRKGYWKATDAQVKEIARLYADSVVRHGADGGPYTGGNLSLRRYVSAALGSPADGETRKAYLAKMDASETAAPPLAAPPAGQIMGVKLVPASQPAAQPTTEPVPPPLTVNWTYVGVGAAAAVLLLVGFLGRVGAPKA